MQPDAVTLRMNDCVTDPSTFVAATVKRNRPPTVGVPVRPLALVVTPGALPVIVTTGVGLPEMSSLNEKNVLNWTETDAADEMTGGDAAQMPTANARRSTRGERGIGDRRPFSAGNQLIPERYFSAYSFVLGPRTFALFLLPQEDRH